MFHKVNFHQFASNSKELAQKKLNFHKEKGVRSSLSIYEVATLMDAIVFSSEDNHSTSSSVSFDICFN